MTKILPKNEDNGTTISKKKNKVKKKGMKPEKVSDSIIIEEKVELPKSSDAVAVNDTVRLVKKKKKKTKAQKRKSRGIGVEGWETSELLELINRMKEQIPADDTMKCKLRVAQLDWDKVKFDGHTAEQCSDAWKNIVRFLRPYKTLREVASDIRRLVEQHFADQLKDNMETAKQLSPQKTKQKGRRNN